MNKITLQNPALTLLVDPHGAEMHSLCTAKGTELLWQADPQTWGRHAPHLFPIVGRLKNDALIHRGDMFPLTQHGFARDNLFKCIDADAAFCRFRLSDSEATRRHYPFAFHLDVSYRLCANTVEIGYQVHNTGKENLPYSLGAHPAFNWPLLPQIPEKTAYSLVFETTEARPIRRLNQGLLLREPFENPLQGSKLALRDELFVDDAVIFDQLHSRKVTYYAQDQPLLDVAFAAFPHLGIWTKPGANFICIEPWQGYASPVDFGGEFTAKPGIVYAPPGAAQNWFLRITVSDAV